MIFLDKNKGGKVEVQYRGVTTNILKKILKAHTKLFLTSDHCCTKGVLAIHPSDMQEAMMTSAMWPGQYTLPQHIPASSQRIKPLNHLSWVVS